MIDDAELRELFRIESDDGLQRLEKGLVQLQHTPGDQAVLGDVFREAHNLKGSARMLEVKAVESLSHALEDVLGQCRRGEMRLDMEMVQRLCRGVDGIRQYVDEAVKGTKPTSSLDGVLQLLAVAAPADAPVAAAPVLPHLSEPPVTAALKHVAEPQAAAPPVDDRLQTLRVDSRRLDRLMAVAAEIRVVQSRVADYVATGDTVDPRMAEESARFDVLAEQLDKGMHGLRLVPLSVLFNPLARMVRDLCDETGKRVELEVVGGEMEVDKRIIEDMKSPLMHLLRNAIDHGIESNRTAAGKPPAGHVTVRGYQRGSHVILEVEDDGGGVDADAVRRTVLARGLRTAEDLDRLSTEEVQNLVFSPGFSTRVEVNRMSGRGVGLDVVRDQAERLRGTVVLSSTPGHSTLFRITVPVSVLTSSVLIVRQNGHYYGIPAEAVRQLFLCRRSELLTVQGQVCVMLNDDVLSLFDAGTLLGQEAGAQVDTLVCVVVESGAERVGLVVEEALDVREVVAKPLGRFLTRVRYVFSVTTLSGGSVCMLLRPSDLVRQAGTAPRSLASLPAAEARAAPVVLLVEDSLVTRVQEKRILEAAGYEVVVAIDGLDALSRMAQRSIDAVVSDVEMPGLDGLGLTRRLRQNPRYEELPIILVTSLASEDDRMRGLEAGANAYITKGAFDQRELLEVLQRLL